MKRRILCVIIAIFMMITPAFAENEITVTVDGAKIEFDQAPVILNGRTLVPVRAVGEALGATVDWNDIERKATISYGENVLVLTIDNNIALVNGADFKLDQAPLILSGRTMVPLRFISEKFGSSVVWDGDARSITITKGAGTTAAAENADPAVSKGIDPKYLDSQGYLTIDYYRDFYPEIYDALVFMNKQVSDDMINYYSSLYDYETSCFYSSTSGKYAYGFHPNIECTSQILHAVQEGAGGISIYDHLTEDQRARMLAYVQSMQDPDDGYFYHLDRPKGKAALNRMNRDLGWATTYILGRYTKGEALYPLPSERMAAEAEANKSESTSSETTEEKKEESAIPDYLKSEEAFLKYLEELWPTKTPYGHGDSMGALGTQAKAVGMYDVLANFIISKQDPETGLWASTPGEVSYNSTSGAMKLAGYFGGAGKQYAHYDKMIDSCIEVLLSDEYAQYIVYIWNPISCLRQVRDQLRKGEGGLPADYMPKILDQMPEIIYKSMDKIGNFKKPDGGSSYTQDVGSESIIDMNIGLGLFESDVDGTGKLRGVRSDVYKLLDMNPADPCFSQEAVDRFFENLRNAKPTVKNTNISYENNFEQYPLDAGEKPEDLTEKVYNDTGSVRVVKNPLDFRNKSLCIAGGKGARTSTRFGGFSLASENGEVQNMEFDMMVESGKYQIYHITLGATVYKLYVTGSGGDKFSLNYVTASSGSGKRITQLPCGEWIHFKLEFVPRGIEDTTVRLYANDEIIIDNGEYYNAGDETRLPHNSLARFAVSGSNDSTGNLYFDNVKAYVTEPEEVVAQ